MKTITRRKHGLGTRGNGYTIQRIVKKAIADAATSDLRGKLQDMVSDSLYNAKVKSRHLKRNVANYAYKKPFTFLGVSLLGGALLSVFISRVFRD